MALYLLSNRSINASPHYTHIYDLEDILQDACNANLLTPAAKPLTKSVHFSRLPESPKKLLFKVLSKTKNNYEKVSVSPEPPSDETNVLFVIGMSGDALQLLTSIDEWRQRFDVVVSFIYDAWLLNAFPRFTSEIDHLFVPMRELIEPLHSKFSIPVSYWPHASNVLEQGSNNSIRSIDVASYGRIPAEYHARLFELSAKFDSHFFYYRQVPETSKKYPEEPYTKRRFDYQHRVLLNKVLAHSKISLAFDFTYTVKSAVELPNYKKHPSYAYRKPVLALRWFEGLASGTTIVGKRPPVPEVDELLNWEDATIELPDDVESGVEVIMTLLEDKERLHAIHQRNYWNALKRHDHRWRIKAAFEQLKLPLPSKLEAQLANIEESVAKAGYGA